MSKCFQKKLAYGGVDQPMATFNPIDKETAFLKAMSGIRPLLLKVLIMVGRDGPMAVWPLRFDKER